MAVKTRAVGGLNCERSEQNDGGGALCKDYRVH